MNQSDEIILSMKSITKFYQKFQVLDEVSFDIKKGEIFGYIGTNGAGKTTTIKIMAGLLQKFQGDYRLNGRSIPKEIAKVRHMFGYMPQTVGFQDWRTTDHALSTFGKLSGMSGSDVRKRIPEVLDLIGIRMYRHKHIRKLSGGTIQKVGIAQAILHKPAFLILDEPLAGLDPESRILVKKVLRDLRDEGTTIFFSSHILSDVQDLADRIGIIDRGKILIKGTLDELKNALYKTEKFEVELYENGLPPAMPDDIKGLGTSVSMKKNLFHIPLTGEIPPETAGNELLKSLLVKGYKIKAFGPYRPSLDDIYNDYIKKNQLKG